LPAAGQIINADILILLSCPRRPKTGRTAAYLIGTVRLYIFSLTFNITFSIPYDNIFTVIKLLLPLLFTVPQQCLSGATENARLENPVPSKIQGWKTKE